MYDYLRNIPKDVRNHLLNSEYIRKLVFYNDANALSQVAPTIEEAKPNFILQPIIYIDIESEEYQINTFVSISFMEAVSFDDHTEVSLKVAVGVDKEIWFLDNDLVRPLEIIAEAAKILDQQKLGPAGRLEVRGFKEIYYNDQIIGYTLFIDIMSERGDTLNDY